MSELQLIEIGESATPFPSGLVNQLFEVEPRSQLLDEIQRRKPIESFVVSTSSLSSGSSWLYSVFQSSGNETHSAAMSRFVSSVHLHAKDKAPDPSEKVASDRIALLARKYAAKDAFADEDQARLSIVTERLRKLAPSITPNEITSLENALNLVKKVAESDKDIRLTLGL